jgi:hypothetical protein
MKAVAVDAPVLMLPVVVSVQTDVVNVEPPAIVLGMNSSAPATFAFWRIDQFVCVVEPIMLKKHAPLSAGDDPRARILFPDVAFPTVSVLAAELKVKLDDAP